MNTETPFNQFPLHESLVNALNTIGFQAASPIQEMTITPVLDGKDIFAQAETGSGKTGSFAIPIVEKVLRSTEERQKLITHVILSPTRELAQQTDKVFNQIGKELNIRTACVIGGENFEKQKEQLDKLPQVLVATPGRLCDLIKQKMVDLQHCESVVFDEADRLFDMGFKKDIEFILGKTPNGRQLIMVSATSNMDVLKTAYKFHSDPLELKLNADDLLVENIDHKLAMLSGDEKMPLLVNILRKHEDAYALVFCNTQLQTHLVAEWLKQMGFKAKPISGRLPQNKRTRLMEEFRSKEVTILVCTDVAARGLDIKDVNLVVNYDLPQEAANYVHRIGRTGRAGASGQAISFCAHEDCENLDAITELIDSNIPRMDLANEDFANDVCKKPYIDYKTLKVVENNQRERGKNKRERKEKFDSAPANLPKVTPTTFEPFIPSESLEGKRNPRVFIHTSMNKELADKAALGYFQVNDRSLLNAEVLKKSLPKYLFFGPRKVTYKYTLNAVYKKLLLPFLIEIIKLTHLKIYAKVSFNGSAVKINFSGSDERLLTRNNSELLYAFETLCRLHVSNKIFLPKNVKFRVECGDSKKVEKELFSLVDRMKKKVLSTKKPILLKPMNSAERRLVHQYLSKDSKVQTNSKGEGRLKQVEISLR